MDVTVSQTGDDATVSQTGDGYGSQSDWGWDAAVGQNGDGMRQSVSQTGRDMTMKRGPELAWPVRSRLQPKTGSDKTA